MTYQEIVDRVSTELGLSRSLVDKVYKAYWKFIKDTIREMPLKGGLTEEEFRSMKTSFSLPKLGKLAVTWERYKAYQESITKYLEEKNAKT